VSIFVKAKHLFEQGDFAEALDLYEKAGESYGWEVVKYNIERCKYALGDSYELDKVTELLIKNKKSGQSKSKELLAHYQILSKPDNYDTQQLEIEYTSKTAFQSNSCPETINDFTWNKTLGKESVKSLPALSIVIPTFNRTKLLYVTLACLAIQKTNYNFEVIVADDGSTEDIIGVVRDFESKFELKYVRQPDNGYQLCAVRNLGLRAAKYPFVAILDCDMAPAENWVESYVVALLENENIAFIGPRKYVDTSSVQHEDILYKHSKLSDFAEIPAKEALGRVASNGVSKDWRLTHFAETDSLWSCRFPFRFFSCGNVAFAKKWLQKVGWFDEEFSDWGGEDNEFGYRLFRAGCFFKSLDGAMAFHQEPPGAENETDRNAGKKITSEIVVQKVPLFYRKPKPIEEAILYDTKLVSIIITGEYTSTALDSLVSSALNQTVVDLHVQVASNGLSPDAKAFAEKKYAQNPRVQFIDGPKKDGGQAYIKELVNSSNSYYVCFILSACTLAPRAIENALELIYKSNDLNYVNASGTVSGDPVFRMFSSRVYNVLLNANKPNDLLALFDL